MLNPDGKVIVVTGGGSGGGSAVGSCIGVACAEVLANEGNRLRLACGHFMGHVRRLPFGSLT
jgi:NAD(P)-dependent dehydrogenase (short-subunit alcohol dehydrogenase family)